MVVVQVGRPALLHARVYTGLLESHSFTSHECAYDQAGSNSWLAVVPAIRIVAFIALPSYSYCSLLLWYGRAWRELLIVFA